MTKVLGARGACIILPNDYLTYNCNQYIFILDHVCTRYEKRDFSKSTNIAKKLDGSYS